MPARTDPSAHFSIFEVSVWLGEHQFTICAEPATTWLAILTDSPVDATDIIPGLLIPADQQRFDDMLFEQGVDTSELLNCVQEVIGVVSGHPWWWTLELLSLLLSDANGTQYLGEMSQYDADSISLGNWCNALYALTVRYMKREDRLQLDAKLDMPPASLEIDPEDLIDETAATNEFFRVMNG